MLNTLSFTARRVLQRRAGLATLAVALLVAGCGQKSEAANTAAPTAAAASGATAAKGANWVGTVSKTADGGFLMGNPNAAIKLIEFGSFTCPHCADFFDKSHGELKNEFIASGKVNFEFRNIVLNGPDAAISLIVRCEGPTRFFPLTEVVYSRQTDWVKGFQSIPPEQQKQLETTPQDQQLAVLTQMGGLDSWLKQVGIPKSRIDQCLAKKDDLETLNTIRKVAFETFKINGTPSFVINGESFEGQPTWPALKAKLLDLTK